MLAAMLLVAGCGGSAAPTGAVPGTTAVGTGGAAGSGNGVTFAVTVSFTGSAEVSGTFVDTHTGRGFSSCAAYVNAILWTSPGAVTGTEQIGGVPIAFDFATAPGQFAGPGHYAPGVMGRLSIGTDTFSGTQSWVTLAEDGSGNGWFKDFMLEGGGAATNDGQAAKLESGTVSWTCLQ
jgi:hypothetical protein